MRALGGFCMALFCAGGLCAQYRAGQGVQGHSAPVPAIQGHGAHSSPPIRWPYSGYGSPAAGRARTTFVYPLFVGGFYDYGSYGGYAPYGYADPYAVPALQQPNVVMGYPAEQAPATASPVIINIGIPPAQPGPAASAPPPPAEQEQPETQAGGAAAESSHYLIALKDHTIYSALAYWVDGNTLHYFTSGNTHNQISLSLVDRDLTQRLNQGSGLHVDLPPAR
jgi:hypothetical protein